MKTLIQAKRTAPSTSAKALHTQKRPASYGPKQADNVSKTQTQLANAQRFGFSISRIPIFPSSRQQGETSLASHPALSTSRTPSDTVAYSLPKRVRQKMESAFRHDFSSVRIREGAEASSIGAIAYTHGTDIHFARGAYQPESTAGQMLIGHELAHVVQQQRGRVPPRIQMKGFMMNHDDALEKEADVWARESAVGSSQYDGTMHGDASDRSAVESSSKGTAQAIQCKFGFELELGVLLSQKYDKSKPATDASAYADPGLGKQEYIAGDPATSLISLTEDHASGGPRSDNGVRFEEHVKLSNEERKQGYRSRIGVVPPPGTEPKVEVEEKQQANPELKAEKKELEYEIKEEKSYTSILEIVTKAVDETAKPEDAIAPMEEAYKLAETIEKATEGLTKRVPITSVIPDSKKPDLYLGYDDPEKHGQTLAANIQASYGLQLAAIPGMLEEHAKETSPEDKSVITETQKNLEKLWRYLNILSNAKKLNIPLPSGDAKIKGLLSLISLYLYSGKSGERSKGLDKNIVPLLIRHPLGQATRSLSGEEKAFLSQNVVIEQLLAVNGRKDDELLFKERDIKAFPGQISQGGDQPRCGEWIRAVIKGEEKGDIFHFFEETKEIGPQAGNPQVPLDVVLEARTIKSNQPPKEEAHAGRVPPDQWVAMAKSYQEKLLTGNKEQYK